jgi:aspartate/methionine/tyrosine aminotransferase
MPRYPNVAPTVAAMPGDVYSSFASRLTTYRGEIYPLHLGDTWLDPAPGCRLEDIRMAENPGMYRYPAAQGLPILLEAIVERERAKTGVPIGPENLLVGAGATGALSAVVGAIVQPGDEVLLLAPYWPLFAGTVRIFHGVPVDVPFFGTVDSPESAVAAVAAHLSPRSAALYINTPNNPTGQVLPRAWVEALVEWAAAEGLWVISDEVYDHYVFRGEHTYGLQLLPERTFVAQSFSKAYGMAGNRCGYVIGPEPFMGQLKKISVNNFYSAPNAAQLAARRVLGPAGDAWVAAARASYRTTGDKTAARLGVTPPESSMFLFIDVADHLDERGLQGFLEDCADRGLLLAPGQSFGPYPTHVRLCYTATSPEIVARGVEVLASIMGRGGAAADPTDAAKAAGGASPERPAMAAAPRS